MARRGARADAAKTGIQVARTGLDRTSGSRSTKKSALRMTNAERGKGTGRNGPRKIKTARTRLTSVRNTEGGISMGIAHTNTAARVMRKPPNKG